MNQTFMTANPPYEALTTEPYTLKELDKHPDRNKLWATLLRMKEEAYLEGYDDGYSRAEEREFYDYLY